MTRPNTRLSDSERNDIRTKVNHIMYGRRVLAPKIWHTETDTTLVKQCYTFLPPDVRAAIDLLKSKHGDRFHGFLADAGDTAIRLLGDDNSTQVGLVEINFRHYVKFIMGGYRHEKGVAIKPQHPMYEPVLDYCMKCKALDAENEFVQQLVHHVTMYCNTYGQINRVWPDLLTTINNGKVGHAQKQTRASNLPEDLDAHRVILERDRATMLLAQAVILPDDDTTGPTVWGGTN